MIDEFLEKMMGQCDFDDLAEKFKVKIDGTSQWTVEAWKPFRTLILPNNYCISEQSRDIQEVISLILHFKTMYYCLMNSPRTSTTSGTVMNCTPSLKSGLIPGKRSLKEDRQSVFCTEEVQYDLDKPRNAVCKNTWRSHQKHSVLGQFKARSEERIAVISNTITRNRSLPHTTCDLY